MIEEFVVYLTNRCVEPVPEDEEELALLLVEAKGLLEVVREWAATVETALHRTMKDRRLVLDGVGVFDKMPPYTRKGWDVALVASQVAMRAIDRRVPDPQTGLIEAPQDAVVRTLLEAAHIDYFRVGVLRELGIDPDPYCEKIELQPRVKFTK